MGASSSVLKTETDSGLKSRSPSFKSNLNGSVVPSDPESSTSIRNSTSAPSPVHPPPQSTPTFSLLKTASFFRLSSSTLLTQSPQLNIKSDELNSSLNKSKSLIQNNTKKCPTKENNVDTERSTTRKAGSVRQIALINHSKQEHAYIRVEDVSLHFASNSSTSQKALVEKILDNDLKLNSNTPICSSSSSTSSLILSPLPTSCGVINEESQEIPCLAPARINNTYNYLEEDLDENERQFTLNKMLNFKTNLNLKLNLNLDDDSSDNDETNDHDNTDQNTYDKFLIEVPSDVDTPTELPSKLNLNLNLNLNNNNENFLRPIEENCHELKFDINGASLTENGIIRPNEEDMTISMDTTYEQNLNDDKKNSLNLPSSPSSPSSPTKISQNNTQNNSNSNSNSHVKTSGSVRKTYRVKLPLKDRLIIVGKLGSGASSVVYKALDIVDMKIVALKVIKVHDPNKRVQMMTELTALFAMIRDKSRRESSHLPKGRRPDRYIVDFYDAFINQEEQTVSFMMEYMDGKSLQDIVEQGGCENEHTLANIAIQSLKGLQFLHNSNQLHRDIKPANFLITHRGEVKLADLGLVKQLKSQNSRDPGGRTSSFVGTAVFFSPEKINGNSYSYGSDVWAFGLSMLLIALGHFPDTLLSSSSNTSAMNNPAAKDAKQTLVGMGYWQLVQAINDDNLLKYISKINFSSEFRSFLSCCLEKNEKNRSTVKELLHHPFMSKVISEDLTYNQSYDRGINEFTSILNALREHIKVVKNSIFNEFKTENLYKESKIYKSHCQIFGNLWTFTNYEILKFILFPDFSSDPQKERPTRRTSRLAKIAIQLHLPLEKLILETKKFCEKIEKDDSNM